MTSELSPVNAAMTLSPRTRDDLVAAGFTNGQTEGVLVHQARQEQQQAAASSSSLVGARAAYDAYELRRAGFTPVELLAAGYSPTVLKEAKFSIRELHGLLAQTSVPCTAADLYEGGFSPAELRAAGVSVTELRDAGFGAIELRREAQVSLPELKQVRVRYNSPARK